MEKTKPYKGQIGTDIEQFVNGIELIARGDFTLTKGKRYPVISIHLIAKELAVRNDDDITEWFNFDEVPDYFEIRIRE